MDDEELLSLDIDSEDMELTDELELSDEYELLEYASDEELLSEE